MKENPSALERRIAALKYLASHQVDIGLPESASARNRMILAIQEHGSPIMRIPPRPVVQPGLARSETRASMKEALSAAVAAAQNGDLQSAQSALASCGQAGADGIRAYIDSGIQPGNSPVTIHGGWIYNRPAKKGAYVKGKGFDKPLYASGELYRAFSYEVKLR